MIIVYSFWVALIIKGIFSDSSILFSVFSGAYPGGLWGPGPCVTKGVQKRTKTKGKEEKEKKKGKERERKEGQKREKVNQYNERGAIQGRI